jgi:DNA-binding SARP family transcriptional activator
LQDALQTCRTLGIQKSIPILETELGVVYRRLGQPELTARYYASALKAWEKEGNTGWKARLLNNMGLLYHMTGKLDEAYPLLIDALKTAERSGYTRIQTNVLISLGDLLTDLSDLKLAYEYYDKALTLATHLGNSLYIFYASLGEARLKRLRGESLLAVKELRQVELSQVRMGIYEKALFNLELGCCWLESNKLEPAVVILRDAVTLFKEGGNPMEEGIAQLWLEVASSVGYPDVAIVKIKELIPPDRQWQMPTPLMVHAIRAGRWLKKRGSSQLFKDSTIREFFAQAERISQSLPVLYRGLASDPNDALSETPRLDIRSFGSVQLLHNQQNVGLSDWQTREARDLFFFLLQSPPLTKEQIALEFWPDISPARLKMRFKINVYRIRQAIGPDAVIFENERYSFNRSISYIWDREKFDDLLRASKHLQGFEKIQLLEQAMEIMGGPYMADLDADWAVSDRIKYHDIYQDLILELADLYLANDQARDCVNMARRALKLDPLLEAGHRLIIQAYATLHDPAGMTLQFRQYQDILNQELGLQPSNEISALYDQLLDAI